jgi:hypothetical protein
MAEDEKKQWLEEFLAVVGDVTATEEAVRAVVADMTDVRGNYKRADVDRVLGAALEHPHLPWASLLKIATYLPEKVLEHPMFEAKVWSGEFRFDVEDFWTKAMVDCEHFPPYLEPILYDQLEVEEASDEEGQDPVGWTRYMVHGLGMRRTLPRELVWAWASKFAGSPWVKYFFQREDVKEEVNELAMSLLRAPQYAGDREKFSRRTFRALMSLEDLQTVWTDETIAAMLEAVREDSRHLTGIEVIRLVYGDVSRGDDGGTWAEMPLKKAGPKTLEVALTYDEDVVRFLAKLSSLPVEVQWKLAKGEEALQLVQQGLLSEDIAKFILGRVLNKEGSPRWRWVVAEGLAVHRSLSWEDASKLWDLLPCDHQDGLWIRKFLLERSDVPREFYDAVVNMPVRTDADRECYVRMSGSMPLMWRRMAEKKLEEVDRGEG